MWAAVAADCQETGLVPFLLEGLAGSTERPWDRGEFDDPADTGELDHIDPAALMASLAQYGIYAGNAAGPGQITNSYASNMAAGRSN